MNSGRKCFALLIDLLGNEALLHDALIVINIVQEKIERLDALHQPALDMLPFIARE